MSQRLIFEIADITNVTCDVVVNAANPALAGIGPDLPPLIGGVDGAIHRAAGKALYEFCIALPEIYKDEKGLPVRCEPGCCVTTPGFNLGKPIIHAVAPGRNTAWVEALTSLYIDIFISFMALRHENHLAIPAIGTGSYGLEKEEAAQIAVREASKFLNAEPAHIVTFCLFSEDDLAVYKTALKSLK